MEISYFIASKAYLLDSDREIDLPIPIFKSFSQLLEENSAFLILFCLILLIFSLVFLFIKRKKKTEMNQMEPEPTDPYEDALEGIRSLQSQNPPLQVKPFVFRLSEILRIYVERVFRVPAMELTGEEFMREIASNTFFKNRYDKILQEFIEQGDRIKYSKESTEDGQMMRLLDTALHFVKDTHAKLEDEITLSSKKDS